MRDPDIIGGAARAWRYGGPTAAKPSNIVCYLANSPRFHPFWQWWVVGCISLRDVPGLEPAHKHYADAEYEFIIFSINPEACPNPDPDDWEKGYPHLVPIDVVIQFDGVSNTAAAGLCERAVRSIADGHMSPDQDFRQRWQGYFRAAMRELGGNAPMQGDAR